MFLFQKVLFLFFSLIVLIYINILRITILLTKSILLINIPPLLIFYYLILHFLKYHQIYPISAIKYIGQKTMQQGRSIEQNIFVFQDLEKHFTTYFIPVYVQAVIQDIVSIDYERYTVTANFVLYFTICHEIHDKDIKQFVKTHWHLQSGYNTSILYPQSRESSESNPFIITKVISSNQNEGNKKEGNEGYSPYNYSTFKVQGNFECPAQFNLFYFPYKEIKVQNYFCFRSQRYNIPKSNNFIEIKYNIMQLKQSIQMQQQFKFIKYEQFYSRFPKDNNDKNKIKDRFGAYSFKHDSSMRAWSNFDRLSKQSQKQLSIQQKLLKILDVPLKKLHKNKNDHKELTDFFKNQKPQFKQNIIKSINQIFEDKLEDYDKKLKDFYTDKIDKKQQIKCTTQIYESQFLSSSKYIVMNFRLYCFKPALILKEEIPIWILSIISLFLFHSKSDNIGNRFSNIILLLVSYVGVITNFRSNNVSQSGITLYELKTMSLAIVPFLLIISSRIDFYNHPSRQNQIDNPFAIVSLIIVLVQFLITVGVVVYTSMIICRNKQTVRRTVRDQQDHINCIKNLDMWEHKVLRKKLMAMQEIQIKLRNQLEIIQQQMKVQQRKKKQQQYWQQKKQQEKQKKTEGIKLNKNKAKN